jgi:hypothetical protein
MTWTDVFGLALAVAVPVSFVMNLLMRQTITRGISEYVVRIDGKWRVLTEEQFKAMMEGRHAND